MTTRWRFGLRHLLTVVGLTAAMLPPVLLASAPAAHAAVCPPNSGVSVVVDFGQLGSVSTGCASGSPDTGLKALSGAGFSYSYVPGQTGMICRINSLPDPCPGTPPVDKYWSYWIADRGGDWAYSSKGAGNRKPPVGSVEGWAFGAGKPPAQAPPAKGSTGGGGSVDGGGDSGTGGGGGDDGGSEKSGKPESSESGKKKADKESSAAAGESGAANGSGDGGAAESEGTAAGYDNAASVGPRMGTVGGVFGAAVVAVLAAAIGWRVWQRRREPGRTSAGAPPEPAE